MAGGPALGRALKLIKEQLRALPDNGLGYGLLRYLNRETAPQLAGHAAPQLGFNYLGRFAAAEGADWAASGEGMTLGGGGDPAMALAHAIEVNALTRDGADGATLTASWTYAPALLTEEEVHDLAQRWFRALAALVRHAEQPNAGGRTPSDLPLVALSQDEIEGLERQYPQLEDVLPLSPLQEGLLFHALYDARAPDVYTVQLVLSLQGRLDEEALKAAAQALIERHAGLRAAFRHEGLSRPVQVIVPGAQAPWRSIDLSLLDAAEREQRLAGILEEDRGERFDLGCPPLLRFALIRLSADEHRLVLTNHHLLMDGWSMPVLVRELLTLYAQHGDAGALPRVTPYRDYLAWIAAQDRDAALAAWQDALAGLDEGTRLAPPDRARAPVAPEQITHLLSETLTTELSQQARRHGLTLNTLIQAAWGMLLGRLSGRDDVVFGVTVAGRPPEIAGIEQMVGLFINTLPLRIKLAAGKPLHHFAARGAGEPVAADGAPACGPGGDPGSGGGGGAVRHLGGVRELSGRAGELCGGVRRAAADRGRGPRRDALSLEPDGGAWGAAAAAAGIPARPVRSRQRRGADRTARPSAGGCGCRSRARDRQHRHPRARRARHHPARVERHRARDPVRHLAASCSPRRWPSTPDAIAVVHEDERLTYAELDARANQLAHRLQRWGVGPDVLVGLCVERSLEMVVGLLAVLKAGGAYVPLDPEYPAERLQYMMSDAGLRVLLTHSSLAAAMPIPTGLRRVLLDQEDTLGEPDTAPSVDLHPGHLAYMIYTSGSTGTPKGACQHP